MNEVEERYTQIHKSITQLWGMGMNTPQVIVRNLSPSTERERIMNVAYVKVIAERVKQRVVIPGHKNYKYLEHLDFWDAVKDYNGEALVIFRAPKSDPIITGICQPSLHYNRISINESPMYSVHWSDSKLLDFPAVLHRAIQDLNGMLVRGKAELDGMSIRFSFHSKSEGTSGDKIVLWGQNF